MARKAFDIAQGLGFNFTLLDIGGGFPGYNQPNQISFAEIAAKLGPVIDRLFPSHVRVIAEPGRYFVCSAYTLAVNVVAKRSVSPTSFMCLFTSNLQITSTMACMEASTASSLITQSQSQKSCFVAENGYLERILLILSTTRPFGVLPVTAWTAFPGMLVCLN